MNEKKNLTTEETLALAIQNHQKKKFEAAENLYKDSLLAACPYLCSTI